VLAGIYPNGWVTDHFDEEVKLCGDSPPGGVGDVKQEWPCRQDTESSLFLDLASQGLAESLPWLDATARQFLETAVLVVGYPLKQEDRISFMDATAQDATHRYPCYLPSAVSTQQVFALHDQKLV
jgi:hypothetical protein